MKWSYLTKTRVHLNKMFAQGRTWFIEEHAVLVTLWRIRMIVKKINISWMAVPANLLGYCRRDLQIHFTLLGCMSWKVRFEQTRTVRQEWLSVSFQWMKNAEYFPEMRVPIIPFQWVCLSSLISQFRALYTGGVNVSSFWLSTMHPNPPVAPADRDFIRSEGWVQQNTNKRFEDEYSLL